MKLVQCWDDGVTSDLRLLEMLRAVGAKATFNLNAGLHQDRRTLGWLQGDTEVWRLARGELPDVYRGFDIANHSLNHPCLDTLPLHEARREIEQGRAQLEQIFGRPVRGFVYPFGRFNPAVVDAVRQVGHVYGRTTGTAESDDGPFAPADPMRLAPHCHFQAADFWERFERARPGGVFYFWGHSYEMTHEAHWQAFGRVLERLGRMPDARWCHGAELFDGETR
jgi:peptidoglycan/xylan/chitin deacetylase (PgdA/CDA1 family)